MRLAKEEQAFRQIKEIIKLLLSKEVSIDLNNLLEDSIKKLNTQMVKFLIKSGAKLDPGHLHTLISLLINSLISKAKLHSRESEFVKKLENDIAQVVKQLLKAHDIGSSKDNVNEYKDLLETLKEYNFKQIGKVIVVALEKQRDFEKAVKLGVQAPILSFGQHIPAELADYIYELSKK